MDPINWITTHGDQLTGVVIVAILLTFGRSKILPGARSNKLLMWVAFVVTAICGLILGWSLLDLTAWLTSLPGVAGVIGSIGALVAVALGWHGVYLLIALIRDLADGTPDEDARKAALWVPTFLPAGGGAVWGIVSHPQGLGTGLAAAIMGGITLFYAHKIIGAVLAAQNVRTAWLWFAAGVSLLAGLAATPLLLYLDGLAARFLTPQWLLYARLATGAFGLALLIAAIKDITDKVPDAYVRTFLRYGLPILITFGALTVGFITGHASNGAQVLTGSMR